MRYVTLFQEGITQCPSIGKFQGRKIIRKFPFKCIKKLDCGRTFKDLPRKPTIIFEEY